MKKGSSKLNPCFSRTAQKKVRIELGRRLYFLLISLVIVAGVLGIVYAYGGTNPAVMGHSLSEIETCADGQSLITVNGEWTCSDVKTGNCGWKELPQVECDTNGGNSKCRGKISLQEAINEGYTGACYFQKRDNGVYVAGTMVIGDKTTSPDTTMIVCKRINDHGTDTRYLDATHKAYYKYCD